jgi:predicted PurR-regulated permease PerM
LRAEQRRALLDKFILVVRATVKGTLVVAIVQGTLGHHIRALGHSCGPTMGRAHGLLSLLPAVGSCIVWVPVAVYLLVTGEAWKGLILLAYGALVIGLVDNFLRPVLVGKDIRMPDYVVLISTLGGLVVFGINGFVIGPLIAALFITVWDIFAASRKRMNT